MDPKSHVGCETLVAPDLVVTAGEIACDKWDQLDPESIAREVVRRIGYVHEDIGFSYKTFKYLNYIQGQSPDIAQGIRDDEKHNQDQGAGDQGMMFGYASDETPQLMPATIQYSHELLLELAHVRKTGALTYLRPDSKSQVTIRYEEGIPKYITNVVISHQTEDVPLEQIREDMIAVAKRVLEPTGLLTEKTVFYVNPTGRFVVGGPNGDSGLTGRKIIVDSYGGVGCHGGGAFSGKDPSKVDRSAAYYSRYVAKNIVAAGLARRCEIQVAYAIGVARPMSINVSTFGTGTVDDARIQAVLENSDLFDFRPFAIIERLGLTQPQGWSYQDTAAYGHFGREQFPWEKTDAVEALRRAVATQA